MRKHTTRWTIKPLPWDTLHYCFLAIAWFSLVRTTHLELLDKLSLMRKRSCCYLIGKGCPIVCPAVYIRYRIKSQIVLLSYRLFGRILWHYYTILYDVEFISLIYPQWLLVNFKIFFVLKQLVWLISYEHLSYQYNQVLKLSAKDRFWG